MTKVRESRDSTTRHDAFQAGHARPHLADPWLHSGLLPSCSVGAGNWFGAAGVRPGSRGYRRADVVMAHYYGPGRHLFLDCAITDPCSGGALSAVPSSATSSGVAAEQRAEKKVAKYGPLAASVSSMFRPAVVERFGACCDWSLLAVTRGGYWTDPRLLSYVAPYFLWFTHKLREIAGRYFGRDGTCLRAWQAS